VRTSILLLFSKCRSIGKYADTAVVASHCSAAAGTSNAHLCSVAATSLSGADSPSLDLRADGNRVLRRVLQNSA
jgi:hypothetical protein